MNKLTRQEQIVLATVMFLLLVGWIVKAYRTANPPEGRPIQSVRTNS
jgi:hypothetical protein